MDAGWCKMSLKVLDKRNISNLLETLMEECEVYAPVDTGKVIRFSKIASADEAKLDYQNTKIAPKEIVFPQTEVLFTIEKENETVKVKESTEDIGERVLFGVRPCDSKGLVLLDKLYTSGEHLDTPFMRKMEKTAVVGLACTSPRSTCFCSSMGGSPFATEGMDLLLVDAGDEYLIETISPRGERLLENVQCLRDAGDEERDRIDELRQEAEGKLTKLSIDDITEKLEGMFEDPVWEKAYQKCVNCGICSFVCPTCWCFDMVDEEESGGVKRCRLWDTCQFTIFTLHGSGHNPRPTGKERMRQRIMHKFSYYPTEFGELACVGCGRCVVECPVNLDIREIVETIAEKGGEP